MQRLSDAEVKAAADRAEARARHVSPKDFVGEAISEGELNAELAKLAALPIGLYESKRRAEARRLGVRASILDKLVASTRPRERKQQSMARKETTNTLDSEKLAQSAADIIASDNILDLFAADFAKVIAGESANGKLIYLVCTSRLFERTMNAAIKGPSAAGKSEIRKRILEFLPPESVVSFTSLSEKSLIYYDGDFNHKILSMGEASALDEQAFQDYLLRELMSEGRIRYPTVQKVGNELVTVIIEKEGPVVFLVTTTQNKLHHENETRLLSLEVDDTEDQTKAVLEKVAKVEGLNEEAALIDYKKWQDFQRWLESGERRVVVPFADALADLIPPKAVRLRRDVGQVLRAIKAHALLHRQHRERDGDGQIMADIKSDYATVCDLMHAILAEGSGVAVKQTMAETIAAIERTTVGMSDVDGASAQDIAKELKLDVSATWRRLSAARNDGFVVNLEVRRRMPGKYRTTPQAAKIGPNADILPTPEQLDTRTQATPPKTAQTCKPDEKADTDQEDDVCNDDCTPFAEFANDCKPSANAFANFNSMNGQEKSPPFARLQGFSGGTDALRGLSDIEAIEEEIRFRAELNRKERAR
jgi:hypothetical protein